MTSANQDKYSRGQSELPDFFLDFHALAAFYELAVALLAFVLAAVDNDAAA